jgi:hypothetical protein
MGNRVAALSSEDSSDSSSEEDSNTEEADDEFWMLLSGWMLTLIWPFGRNVSWLPYGPALLLCGHFD